MVHIITKPKEPNALHRESLKSNGSNKIFPLKSFYAKNKLKTQESKNVMNRSDLEQELREFLKFNSNDFMFINSSFLESMVLKERSYTLILFILNFLAVTITVLFQEVFVELGGLILDLLYL